MPTRKSLAFEALAPAACGPLEWACPSFFVAFIRNVSWCMSAPRSLPAEANRA